MTLYKFADGTVVPLELVTSAKLDWDGDGARLSREGYDITAVLTIGLDSRVYVSIGYTPADALPHPGTREQWAAYHATRREEGDRLFQHFLDAWQAVKATGITIIEGGPKPV